jgi:hypothetical protein
MNIQELIISGVKLRASDMELLKDRSMLVSDADALYAAIRNAYVHRLHVLLDKVKTDPVIVRAALAELDIPLLNKRDSKVGLSLIREIIWNLGVIDGFKTGPYDEDQDRRN